MSFQGFIEIQYTRFNGKDLWRKLRGGQQKRQFRRWDNCCAVWGGAIASLLFTLWTDLTTEIIYSDPTAFPLNPRSADQDGAEAVVLGPNAHPLYQWDGLVQLGGAV